MQIKRVGPSCHQCWAADLAYWTSKPLRCTSAPRLPLFALLIKADTLLMDIYEIPYPLTVSCPPISLLFPFLPPSISEPLNSCDLASVLITVTLDIRQLQKWCPATGSRQQCLSFAATAHSLPPQFSNAVATHVLKTSNFWEEQIKATFWSR